ncbi:MAG: hypothetical protein K9L32_00130 [Chromatiaceae bacterium]|nr:hypothetical protein [Chromatiaceae bacterium]
METTGSQRLFVVLGMHRSGTSAVTRALEVLGVRLGEHLMPAHAGNNDLGFFEDLDVVALNEAVLKQLGYSWYDLKPLDPSALRAADLDTLRQRGADLLRARLQQDPWFGLKDPRMARLVGFWQPVIASLGVPCRYLIVCRHPASVAWSLRRRDGFEFDKGYWLWLEHNLRALRDTLAEQPLVVDYDALMDDPVGQLRRLALRLKIELDPASPALQAYVDGFLHAELRHTRFSTAGPYLPPEVLALYELLSSLASDRWAATDSACVARLEDIEERLLANDRREVADAEAVSMTGVPPALQRPEQALFDAEWYLAQVGVDATVDGVDALQHYLEVGSAGGASPHPLFDSDWYRWRHPDVAVAGIEPLSHYLREGAAEGRDPHPLFNAGHYLAQWGEDAAALANPLLHYLQQAGLRENRIQVAETHPLFDATWYQAAYPWAAATGLSPLEHYLRIGPAQGLDPSPDFDTAWYLSQVPGLDPGQHNPLVHFIRIGRELGLYTQPHTSAVTLAASAPATPLISQRAAWLHAGGCDAAAPNTSGLEPVAVVAHLHHAELLWELLLFLRQLPVPFRLYVSTTSTRQQSAVLRAAARALPGVGVDCRVTPNRGRDWGPLLVAFADVASAHPLLCHVHSKRSGHFRFGDRWRQYLFSHLLGSEAVVSAILALFEADARLGLVFPETFAAVTEHHAWGANQSNTRALLERLGVDAGLVDRHPLMFPAGSMFWCRSQALCPLWQAGLDWADFPAEPVGEDGTLMHAIERALGFVARDSGFRLRQVRVPQPLYLATL